MFCVTDNGRQERGFVVNDDVYNNVGNFEAISNRICYLNIQGKIFDVIILVKNNKAPGENQKNADLPQSITYIVLQNKFE